MILTLTIITLLIASINLCPQDRTIAVWDMKTPKDIVLRRVLVGHRAAVNVVDFDDRYIVSASGDRTIKLREHVAQFSRMHGG